MSDPFKTHQRGLESPALYHFAITPADGVDLPISPRVIKALSDGNVAIKDAKGVVLVYPVKAGEVLQISARGVEATGTTATTVGWY